MPSKPTRPAPKPQQTRKKEAVKEEAPAEPQEAAAKTEEAAAGVKQEVAAPPGLGLVDELQSLSPAQKKARMQLFQLTK